MFLSAYESARRAALARRLDLLDNAYARKIHTFFEYGRIRADIISEHAIAWPDPEVIERQEQEKEKRKSRACK